MLPDPPRKLVTFGHLGLFPQTINPSRQNPVKDGFEVTWNFSWIVSTFRL